MRDDFTSRSWSEAELADLGFQFYEARHVVTMARELPADESPLLIKTAWETLVAEAGYMICFGAGKHRHAALYDYPHWPARTDWFTTFYDPVRDPSWAPTEAQTHLISLGCLPYVRRGGAWAKRVTRATKVQSDESPTPIVVPSGAWVCALADLGAGRPEGFWAMDDDSFHQRYSGVKALS